MNVDDFIREIRTESERSPERPYKRRRQNRCKVLYRDGNICRNKCGGFDWCIRHYNIKIHKENTIRDLEYILIPFLNLPSEVLISNGLKQHVSGSIDMILSKRKNYNRMFRKEIPEDVQRWMKELREFRDQMQPPAPKI